MLNDDINIFLGMFSYPFTHVDFLFKDSLQNYYNKINSSVNYKEDKEELRKKFCDFIRNKYNIYTYDEIYLYLDKWYLYPRYENNILKKYDSFDIIFEHLESFAKSFISQRDGKIIYKYWENKDDNKFLGGFSSSNKIYLFHSLNRLIPLDILVIIYMHINNKDIYELDGNYGNIEVSDILLDKIMEKGVAENHLHKGVAVSFLTAWDKYMQPLDEIDIKNLLDFKIVGRDFDNIKSSANIFLILLANFMRTIILLKINLITDFNYKSDNYNNNSKIRLHNENLDSAISYLIKSFVDGDLKEQLKYFCKNSPTTEEPEWDLFEGMYLKLLGSSSIDCMSFKNILGKSYVKNTTDENLFLYITLDYIYNNRDDKENKNNKEIIKNLFLNYLRIKNHFYQLVVQQKTIHGLNFFQEEFYYKNSNFSKLNREFDWSKALKEQFQNKNLKKLELRATIGNKETDFKVGVNKFLKAYLNILHEDYCYFKVVNGKKKYKPRLPFPRVGLVFHLIKKEEDIDYINSCCKKYIRYKNLYTIYEKEINILNELRSSDGVYNRYLLGIDIASLENAVPTWVYVNIFEKARDSINERVGRNSKKNQSLGFTCHAGEDFRHLMSGLRRIYEVINHLKFHSGDRIGHGVALGLDVERWCFQNNTIIIPRIEALENYIWVYDLLRTNDDNLSIGNLDFIEKQIYKLSSEIYGCKDPIGINILIDAYKELFNGQILEDNYINSKYEKFIEDYQQNQSEFVWTVDRLIAARYHYSFVHRMNEPIHIRIEEQEFKIIKVVQDIVKKDINAKGIIIEINPSSNVVIGDIDTMKENQVYSINNYGYKFDNVMVCINSDDPAIFNTNAANELGYIYFGMLERDSNRENALHWVDKLRENGMLASFIRGRDSDEIILIELEEFVDNI